jgi:steroid Delta-isomerase
MSSLTISLRQSSLEPSPEPELIANRIRHYYALVDNGDVDGVVRLFARGATYWRPGYEPIVGHSELNTFYRTQRVIRSGQHRIAKLLIDRNYAAVEGEFRGVLKDGSKVDLRFADFFRLDDELLFDVRNTYFFSPLV